MTVTIRAFDEKGFHKDIARFFSNGQGMLCTDYVDDNLSLSLQSGLIGTGVGIETDRLSNLYRIEIVIETSSPRKE